MTDNVAGDPQRIIADLQRRLDDSIAQQTATADVLKVVSRSTFDLQTVLETLIKSAVELCGANRGSIFLRDGDVFPLKAASSTTSEFLKYWAANPPRAGRGSATSRVIASGKIELIPDVLDDPDMEMPAGSLIKIRAALGVPMLRNNKVEGVMVLTRPEPGPFTKSQIDLMQTFADQAMIAIENTRLFNETKEALERQTATSEVLSIINSSPGDLKTVFEAMVEKARRLCDADSGHLALPDGDDFRTAAVSAMSPDLETMIRAVSYAPARGTAIGRSLLSRRAVQIADIAADTEHAARHAGNANLIRTILGVPLLREGKPIGAFGLSRSRVEPFTERQIELVETFAAQAVIAIENTRLFNETREALERQTATADVLKVIASSPSDVQPVFDAIALSAKALIRGFSATVSRIVGDKLHLVAFTPTNARADEALQASFPIPLAEFPPFESLGAGATVQFVDTEAEGVPVTNRDVARLRGYRSMLFAPLMNNGKPIGMISVTRTETGAFADHHVELLQTFADQAVIAIENARLFNEVQARTADLQESLQHQTATSDVLRVISRSPGELNPVFETILANATRICDAQFGLLVLYEDGGFRCTSTFNLPTAFAETFLRNPVIYPPPIDPLGRLIETRQLVHVVDVKQEPAYLTGFPPIVELVELGGARTLLLVPMLKEKSLVGVIAIFRQNVHAFSGKQIDLVTNFGSQAVIAIENGRLLGELRKRTDDLSESLQQQTATADVLKVISRSAFDLQTVLETLTRSAVELSGARRGVIFLRDGELFRFRASSYADLYPDWIQFLKDNPQRAGHHSAIARAISSGQTVCVPDVSADPEIKMPAALAGIRAVLAVPLLRDGKVEGVMALSRQIAGDFADRQIELVQTFADQAVIAIENVRLFEQVQARTRELTLLLDELRTAQDRLVQTEKLASLGQLTAGIAHEIKNPLNFVNNFSSLSGELIDELNELLGSAALDGKTREEIDELTNMLKGNLDKVVQHGKRADSIVKNMLLHSREGAGDRRAADINAIVEESLNLAYHGARAEKSGFNITLSRDLDPAAGTIDLFPQEITRVLLNLISNGFYAANKRRETGDSGFEPLLTATTKNLGNKVEIRIRDNGTGISAEVKEKMFNPFFTTKPAGEGTGLGLSMSHDIVVKQHGGKIEVDTEPGQFTEFIITLPRELVAQGNTGGRN